MFVSARKGSFIMIIVNLALRALTKAVYILLSEEFGRVQAVTCRKDGERASKLLTETLSILSQGRAVSLCRGHYRLAESCNIFWL